MISFLDHDNAFWNWLLRTTIHGSVLILLVLGCQWLFRKHLAASWRFALWWLVLIRLSLPASVENSWSLFNFINVRPGAVAVSKVGPQVDSSLAAQPFDRAWPATGEFSNQAATLLPIKGESLTDSESKALEAEGSASFPHSVSSGVRNRFAVLPYLLPMFWCAGVLILGVRTVIHHRRVTRRLRNCRVVDDPAILELLAQCKRCLGVSTSLILAQTDRLSTPALYGVFRPRLLLPVGLLDNFAAAELRHVFLHELAHLKRRDIAVGWITLAIQLVHWFNPLVWFAFSRLRNDRELACDAMALSCPLTGEAKAYGRTIIKLLEGFAKPLPGPGLVGILEDPMQVKERIGMIARFKTKPRWTLVSLLLMVVLGLITLTDGQDSATPAVSQSPTRTGPASHAGDASLLNSNEGENARPATGWFKFEYHSLAQALDRMVGLDSSSPGKERVVSTNTFLTNLHLFFDLMRIQLKDPKVFFSDNRLHCSIMVRASASELADIVTAMQLLHLWQPQVLLDVQWCEVSDEQWLASGFFVDGAPPVPIHSRMGPSRDALTNWVQRVLTGPEFAAMQRRLASNQNDAMTVSRVITLSGRPAELGKSNRDRIDSGAASGAGEKKAQETNMTTLALLVVPRVGPDGYTISLDVTARVREFVGFDLDGGKSTGWAVGGPNATTPNSEKPTNPKPLYQSQEVRAEAVLWDGQTVVLAGRREVLMKGDLPFVGRFFRSESARVSKRNMVIFITPLIVDASGNSTHRVEDMPFRQMTIPPQRPIGSPEARTQ